MAKEHNHEKGVKSCCGDLCTNPSTRQTFSEMEFERGIWHAAQYKDKERVEELLKKGISVDDEDSAGYTALHYAARNGHHQICETLLKHGANVNAKTRSGKATALHRASTQGHYRVVELLLEYGAHLNLQDDDGLTALHRAIIEARLPVCKILLNGTDLTIIDKNNRTVKQLSNEYCKDIATLLST